MAKIMQDKYMLGQSISGEIQIEGQELELNLILQPNINDIIGGNVVGTVVDKSGKAIQGAYVKAMSTTYEPIMHAITDSNGIYSLINLPQGSYNIFCIANGMNLNQDSNVYVTNYQSRTVDFVLNKNPNSELGIIVGDLKDSVSNLPINGAVLYLLLNQNNNSQKLIAITYSNEYGQYAFTRVPNGNYTIKITDLRYETITNSVNVTNNNKIVQLNASLKLIVKGTNELGTISGMIQDNNNKPINGADVILYKVNKEGLLIPVAFTKTNINGIYLFTGVQIGMYKIKSNKLENVTVNPPAKLSEKGAK